jgi:hypothetical protein
LLGVIKKINNWLTREISCAVLMALMKAIGARGTQIERRHSAYAGQKTGPIAQGVNPRRDRTAQ